jgi:hypothetical protein
MVEHVGGLGSARNNNSIRRCMKRNCRIEPTRRWRAAMPRADTSRKRCAIYTRKSSEEGLEQEFNSLAAQREACEAYIRRQQHEGWVLVRTRYDEGPNRAGSGAEGFSVLR